MDSTTISKVLTACILVPFYIILAHTTQQVRPSAYNEVSLSSRVFS